MAIAAYIRVSTKQQDYEAQRQAIETATAARGERVDAWFSEKTGAHHMQRPELDRLRQLVRLGRFSKLYVFQISRFSRSGIGDTLTVIEEMRRNGCALESLADPFGAALGGPLGDLCIAMVAWAAQMERAALNERLHAARARVEARGGAWGRPKKLSGDTIRLALEGIAAGKSLRQVARDLTVAPTTLAKTLRRNPDDLDRAFAVAETTRESASDPKA